MLSVSEFLKDFPELYEKIDDSDKDSDDCGYIVRLNLYNDDNWKKCKKIIEKNIFEKYFTNEIFEKLECRFTDGF
ncbi:hypothetical protein [Acanthamoeba castellanii mimivirus]|uniref:Uncharacterized protein n=3 Tax=Mimivirus TaxID=315393 RepID=A0A0G2YCA9_MIMIV|nr:hypothetical protein [Acanthamoeba polyphaga mimivirus]AMK61724.1 hypothetical protein [Samba virus]UTE95949.1 hypothetical protein LBA-00012 [Acanthamoeba polyphaga mimivirus]BAV61115.1 hypothetical protein [Acanthamoeba castellanii mimivirus]BAV62103.1 hypothetical protein [Acanthamoeba castellanii mimivirus]